MPELSVLSSYTLPSITRPIITASTPSPTTDSKLTVIHSPLSSVHCDHCVSMAHYYCVLLGSVDPAAMAGVGFGVVVLLVLAGSSCLLCMIWQMRRRKRRLELIQEVIWHTHTNTLFYILSYSLSLSLSLSSSLSLSLSQDMFMDPIFIQMGPRTTVNLISPKENGLFHDDWEIPASMVL